MILTDREKCSYAEDGFLVRPAVFSAAEIHALRDAVERAADRAGQLAQTGKTYIVDDKRFVDAEHITVQFELDPGSETIQVAEPVHELDGQISALLEEPKIVEFMRDLVGTEAIAVWTDKLNLKRPREGSGFGWHQDSP